MWCLVVWLKMGIAFVWKTTLVFLVLTPSCRKMNEADKDRFLREKDTYERLTGQPLPVAKVRRSDGLGLIEE